MSKTTPKIFPGSYERVFMVTKIQISKINCKIKSILSGLVARWLYSFQISDVNQGFSPSCRICFHYASLKSQYLMLLHLWPKVAAVKNRRERLISERVSLEESRRVAKEKLSRLESFICSSLGGQGWKIKVACLHLLFLFLKLKDKMADTFLK